MQMQRTMILGLAVAATGMLVSVSYSATISVRRDTVVEVRFEDDLSVRQNRSGDRFSARVDNDRVFPFGTRFEGRVVDVRRASGNRPAFLQLEFNRVRLPDGRTRDIRAVPISLDSRNLRTDADGRIRAQRPPRRENYVIGGMLGGGLLGAIFDKPFEGAFLGTIAGIILAEGENNAARNEFVVRRGTRYGALFERDFRVDYDGPWDARDWRDRERDWDLDWNRNRDWDRDRDWDRFERDNFELSFEGRVLRFGNDERPYRLGDTWMVPVETTARQLRLSVDTTGNRRILVFDDNNTLVLEQGSRRARHNGRTLEMSREVVTRNRVVFAPVDAFRAVRGSSLRIVDFWDDRR